MNSTIKIITSILVISSLFVSCNNDEPIIKNQVNYIKVAEAVSASSSFNVVFYATDSLFVGYNNVYFKITDKNTGAAITHATLVMHPLMNMGTSSHACPFENPADSLTAEGYFKGAVLFSMMGTNSWSLAVDVTANGKTETVTFPIDKVKSTNPVKKIVVMDSLSTGAGTWTVTKYPVSLVEPTAWKTGINTFEITVHTMASMMSFPCCSGMTVEITPEMPSMGHGSPNNVNPVFIGNGHYRGAVNFTMTGSWRINMVFKMGGRTLGTNNYFDIVF
ncbi:MAG: FixH family protein [Paludibacter sp.]|nr:FixH family protein [Paludibacter sp.]